MYKAYTRIHFKVEYKSDHELFKGLNSIKYCR